MRVRAWFRKAAILPVITLAAGACAPDATGVATTSGEPRFLATAISCSASTAGGSVSCTSTGSAIGPSRAEAIERAKSDVARREFEANAAGDVTIGGQGMFVNLSIGDVRYDAAAQQFSFGVAVANLLAQPLGTTDGASSDADGVRVFFVAAPTVTSGTGTVAVANADGVGTFTASNQPYFRYPGILPANATTAPRAWRLGVPTSASTISFQLFVTAKVADNGETAMAIPGSSYTDVVRTGDHTCALRTGGTLYCWGGDWGGQVGRGGPTVSAAPRPILANVTFKEIHGGRQGGLASYYCALATDGTPWCWAGNSDGQLGRGVVGGWSSVPAPMNTNGLVFRTMAAAFNTACALDDAGAAWCWGAQALGAAGTGSAPPTGAAPALTAPTAVVGGHVFERIYADGARFCAIKANGEAWCWGSGSSGQLGNGQSVASGTPVLVAGGHLWKQLGLSNISSCGLTTTNAIYCWGSNGFGQLGQGNNTNSNVPLLVTLPNAEVPVAVWGGILMHCAATQGGRTYCWGDNFSGKLGVGDYAPRNVPTLVTGNQAYVQGAGLASHSCGVRANGTLDCWAWNGSGQLGRVTAGPDNIAPTPVASAQLFTQVALSGASSCALTTHGEVLCFGEDALGQLGDGDAAVSAPVGVLGGKRFTKVVGGAYGNCGITTDGLTQCWGWGPYAQVGDGALLSRSLPSTVAGGHTFVDVALGAEHGCGVTAAGAAWCWGQSNGGKLGDGVPGEYIRRTSPVAVTGGITFQSIAIGSSLSTCGLDTAGAAWCWGLNNSGQLGSGALTDTVRAPRAVDGGHVFTKLIMGGAFACGLKANGEAWCWGANNLGQLGQGTTSTTPSLVPVQVTGGIAFTQLSAYAATICGIDGAGVAWCWGQNASGGVGDGTTTSRSVPTPVSTQLRFTKVAASSYSCGVATGGAVYCWGLGDILNTLGTNQITGRGRLGTDPVGSLTPVRVALP